MTDTTDSDMAEAIARKIVNKISVSVIPTTVDLTGTLTAEETAWLVFRLTKLIVVGANADAYTP